MWWRSESSWGCAWCCVAVYPSLSTPLLSALYLQLHLLLPSLPQIISSILGHSRTAKTRSPVASVTMILLGRFAHQSEITSTRVTRPAPPPLCGFETLYARGNWCESLRKYARGWMRASSTKPSPVSSGMHACSFLHASTNRPSRRASKQMDLSWPLPMQ